MSVCEIKEIAQKIGQSVDLPASLLSLAPSRLPLIQNIRYYQCMKQFNLFPPALSLMKTSVNECL